MKSYDRSTIIFAGSLSLIAGYVDACGYLASGGLFISFMSGNSTRLGISISNPIGVSAFMILGAILLFLFGVIGGSLLSRAYKKNQKFAILALTTILLISSTFFAVAKLQLFGTGLAIIAMGMLNTVFQKNNEVAIGVSYMTGNLVKLGQSISAVMVGEKNTLWKRYLFLWLGLIVGASLGTFSHEWLKELSLIPAILGCATLAGISLIPQKSAS